MTYFAMPGVKYTKFIPDSEQFAKVEYIIHAICQYFHTTFKRLDVDKRDQRLCFPRQTIMYFLKYHGGLSSVRIGKLMKKHHGTVIFGIRKIEGLLDVDPIVKDQLDEIKNLI